MAVYLLHFDRKLSHAQHYIGFSDDVEKRIEQHKAGRSGAGIVAEFHKLGIAFVVARTWAEKGRDFERHLKRKYKRATSLCPLCKGGGK